MVRWLGGLALVVVVGLALSSVMFTLEEERPLVGSPPPPPPAANGDDEPASPRGTKQSGDEGKMGRRVPPAARNGKTKKTAPPPAAANGDGPGGGMGAPPPTVLQTVYDFLSAPGRERPDNALYSYALFPQATPRAEAFLANLLETTGDAQSAGLAPTRLNVLYLPVQEAKVVEHFVAAPRRTAAENARLLAREVYDYPRARAMLGGLCAATSRPLARFCAREPVRGPYVASFRVPVSQRLSDGQGAPVPVLLLDMSDVHEGAFATILAKYKDQVRRPNLPEAETINSLKEKLLSITLEAADLIVPVRKAIAEMIETAEAADSAGKKK